MVPHPAAAAPEPAARIDTISARLLNSSAEHSYDPDVDIGWAAPLDPKLTYQLPQRNSLYETALRDALTPEQRIELGNAFDVEDWLGPIETDLAFHGWPDPDRTSAATAVLALIRGPQLDLAATDERDRGDAAFLTTTTRLALPESSDSSVSRLRIR